MADKKLTDLVEDTAPTDNDLILTTDIETGQSKKVKLSTLLAMVKNQYRFRAYRNAAANSGASAAFAQIVFDIENYDPNSNFASGQYTAPITGTYEFMWRAKIVTGGAEQFQTSLYKNGVGISQGLNISSAGVEHVTSMGVDQIELTAGDVVDVRAMSSGTARALETGTTATYFAGHLVSKT